MTGVSLCLVALGRYGHLKGKERLEQTIRWVLVDLRVPFLTVYALSLDNLTKRSPEVSSVPSTPKLPLRPDSPLHAAPACRPAPPRTSRPRAQTRPAC